MTGVNFQPGYGSNDEQRQTRPSGGGGVQEAIKILSLRLPKVVGAQGIAPMPLLTSPGADGQRVDSVVNQILSRMGMGGNQPAAPVLGPSPGESHAMPLPRAPFTPQTPFGPPPPPLGKPRVIFKEDPRTTPPPGPDPRLNWPETPFPDTQERPERGPYGL